MRARRKILVGDRFGRLVVVSRQNNKAFCRCDCGATKLVQSSDIGRNTNSCGCFRSERITRLSTKHGAAPRAKSGLPGALCASAARTVRTSRSSATVDAGSQSARDGAAKMDLRISSSTWGGDHAVSRSSVARNDGPYSPDNCIWATRSEQAKNRIERPRLSDGTFAPAIAEQALAP